MYTQVFVCICNTGSTSDDKIWVGLGCPQVRAPPDSLHFPPPPSPPSPPLPKFTKNLTKFLILPPSSQVSFEGCQGEQSLTKNILFSLRCSFTGTDKIFLVLHEKKEIGNFSPLTWRGALFHLGIFAFCHLCARKETISSLSSLKAGSLLCAWLFGISVMISCPCNSNTWIKVWWKMLKSESWLTVPPPKEKVFVRCPGRDSIFGRESFLRVTILPTSGKLPISMPPHAHAHAFPFSYANPNSQNDAFKFHLRLVSSSHTIS